MVAMGCCCAPACSCSCANCFCGAPSAMIGTVTLAQAGMFGLLSHTADQCCAHDQSKEHEPKAVVQKEKGKTIWQRIKAL